MESEWIAFFKIMFELCEQGRLFAFATQVLLRHENSSVMIASVLVAVEAMVNSRCMR